MSTAARTVEQFIEAIERRDLDAALALVADDCVYDHVPVGPVSGPMRGSPCGATTSTSPRTAASSTLGDVCHL